MTKTETVRALLSAIEAQRWDEARGYLADDFAFSGAVPQPVNADAWLAVHKAFAAAMPDFSFNARDIREEESSVRLQVQPSGTQTRELALPIPGIPAIAPTGKRVQLAPESCACEFRGDKLISYHVHTTPGGGVQGILAQLGVAAPTA
jgi:predicted ester cyclase